MCRGAGNSCTSRGRLALLPWPKRYRPTPRSQSTGAIPTASVTTRKLSTKSSEKSDSKVVSDVPSCGSCWTAVSNPASSTNPATIPTVAPAKRSASPNKGINLIAFRHRKPN